MPGNRSGIGTLNLTEQGESGKHRTRKGAELTRNYAEGSQKWSAGVVVVGKF